MSFPAHYIRQRASLAQIKEVEKEIPFINGESGNVTLQREVQAGMGRICSHLII